MYIPYFRSYRLVVSNQTRQNVSPSESSPSGHQYIVIMIMDRNALRAASELLDNRTILLLWLGVMFTHLSYTCRNHDQVTAPSAAKNCAWTLLNIGLINAHVDYLFSHSKHISQHADSCYCYYY